jgi:hypothetical protein
MKIRHAILLLLLASLAVVGVGFGCSLGQGVGEVVSQVTCGPASCSGGLFVHQCWGTPPSDGGTQAQGGPYDLGGDLFFAANSYQSATTPGDYQLQIRVQRGTDLEEFSDGLEVQLDSVNQIINAIQAAPADGGVSGSDAGSSGAGGSDGGVLAPSGSFTTPCQQGEQPNQPSVTFRVALSSGLHPPGSVVEPPQWALDSIVHASLYLERSCHYQNATLYAVDGTMTFRSMFDGISTETDAAKKFIDADFDLQVADISDAPAGAYAGDVPPGLQSRVQGCFRFYYQAGQPAQPFP